MKKIFTLLAAILIIFTMIPASILALENTERVHINCSRKINGNNYYSDYFAKKGEKIVLSIEDLTINGQIPESSNVSYQWTCETQPNIFENIEGATKSSYEFEYNGITKYDCSIIVNDIPMVVNFVVKEDTLSLKEIANPQGKLDEDNNYQIYDVSVGQTVTLTADAVSTFPNANLTYEWERIAVGTNQMPETLENNLPTITLKKATGVELYSCTVSDGNMRKYVYFYINPANTLTVTPSINGVKPKRFERGYMYVAKPGEEITMKVDAASTNGNVEYLWQNYEFIDDEYVYTNMGTTNSETVIKRAETPEPYGVEMYECYIKDGNELKNISFILFTIAPEQVTTDIVTDNNVPSISINNSIEDLSNDLLKDNLDKLSNGQSAELKLTAEEKTNLSTDEQKIINEQISQESKVGMYLDINLYKKVEGDPNDTQITETQKNINISIDIPEELRNNNENLLRNYKIIRVHDGVATALEVQYNAESNELTFNTDRFSTYALVYEDKIAEHIHGETEIKNTQESTCTTEGYTGDKVCTDCREIIEKGKVISKLEHDYKDGKCTICDEINPTHTPDVESIKPQESVNTSSSSNPKTSDDTNIALWFVMILLSSVTIISLEKRKNK